MTRGGDLSRAVLNVMEKEEWSSGWGPNMAPGIFSDVLTRRANLVNDAVKNSYAYEQKKLIGC